MTNEAKELKGFLDAIAKDPRDLSIRKIFADWLEDHDEPELADEQRSFDLEHYDALEYLKDFDGPHMVDDEFWHAVEVVSKKELSFAHRRNASFACSC